MSDFTLANREHMSLLTGLLLYSGALCPKCGHGTRATSKRWRKCKKCGERVERRNLDDLTSAPAPERGERTEG